jgi:hypothetical protein
MQRLEPRENWVFGFDLAEKPKTPKKSKKLKKIQKLMKAKIQTRIQNPIFFGFLNSKKIFSPSKHERAEK